MTRPILLLFLGRDDWQKDLELTTRLLRKLSEAGIPIQWEDPVGRFVYRLRLIEDRFTWLPRFGRTANLRVIQLVYAVFHWRYPISRKRLSSDVFERRCDELSKTFSRLTPKNDLVVLCRSSGGRAASLIADRFPIKRLICLGYPFRHPSRGDEPERYTHLADLRTPFLILQGTNDEYGTAAEAQNLPLSRHVRILPLETNHEFHIDSRQFETIVDRILESIRDLQT